MIELLPYIVFFLLFLLGALFEINSPRKDQVKMVRGFLFLVFVCFVGLRYKTGADCEMYMITFRNMPEYGNYSHWEWGYYWFSNFIFYLTKNYAFLQCLVTIFLLYALNKLYKNYTDFPLAMLALFLPLFFESIIMAQIRQSIALSIVVLGTPYVIERKNLKFIMVVAVACLFHISALLTLPLYFMSKKWNKSVCFILILISQFILLQPTIVQDILLMMANWFPGRLGELLNSYANSEFFQPIPFSSGIYYIAQLLLSLFILWIYKPTRPVDYLIINALVITVLIQTLSTAVNILGRFQVYYQVYGLMAYSALITLKIKGAHTSLSRTLFYGFLFCMFLFPKIMMLSNSSISRLTGRPENAEYIPYRNFINNPQEVDVKSK